MVIAFVVSIVEDVGCIIVFIAGQDLFRVEFVAYDEVVSGIIVEFISVVIRQDTVGISVVTSYVVVIRGVIYVVVTR